MHVSLALLVIFSADDRKQDLTFHANCLHEMSNPVFWKKNKKNINLSSAEFAQRVIKVKSNGNSSLTYKYILKQGSFGRN